MLEDGLPPELVNLVFRINSMIPEGVDLKVKDAEVKTMGFSWLNLMKEMGISGKPRKEKILKSGFPQGLP